MAPETNRASVGPIRHGFTYWAWRIVGLIALVSFILTLCLVDQSSADFRDYCAGEANLRMELGLGLSLVAALSAVLLPAAGLIAAFRIPSRPHRYLSVLLVAAGFIPALFLAAVAFFAGMCDTL